jgi:hypothetical protein
MLWILNRNLNGKNCLQTILNGCPHIYLRKVLKFIKDSGYQFIGSNLEMVSSEKNYFHFVKILYYLGIPYDKNDTRWGIIWQDRILYMYYDLDWWALWYDIVLLCMQDIIRYVWCMINNGNTLVNDQLDAQLFFRICLFQICTCFEHSRAHHQNNELYQYDIWYMSLYVGDRLLCRFGFHPNLHNRRSPT